MRNENGSSNCLYESKFVFGVFERLQIFIYESGTLALHGGYTQVYCMITYSNYMLQFTVSVSSEHA